MTEAAQQQILRPDRVIVGDGLVHTDTAVVVRDDRISALIDAGELEREQPSGEVVDLSGCSLMPGMIDCHMHLPGQNILTHRNFRVAMFEETPQLQQLYALLHGQMCFEMGVTTIRDFGWPTPWGHLTRHMVAVRQAIESGMFAGPRLLVGGWSIATGSHLDLIIPRDSIRPLELTADGPDELRKLTRQHLRDGADVIKTCASGGGGTDREEPDVLNMSMEELKTIVEEAHFFHKKVACHCFTPQAQHRAIRAGVDTIEHCVWTDDEAIKMLVDTDTPLIPTLTHRTDEAIRVREQTGTSKFVIDKMRRLQPDCYETFQRYHQGGVKIAMGTDMGLDPEMARNALELDMYVRLGMTPSEAITTATRNAAEALGMEDWLGTVEADKCADLLAVAGNPLEDITVLQSRDDIKMVMKEGTIHVDRRPGHERHVISDQSWGWDVAGV